MEFEWSSFFKNICLVDFLSVHSFETSKKHAGISEGGFSEATHLNCCKKVIGCESDSFKSMKSTFSGDNVVWNSKPASLWWDVIHYWHPKKKDDIPYDPYISVELLVQLVHFWIAYCEVWGHTPSIHVVYNLYDVVVPGSTKGVNKEMMRIYLWVLQFKDLSEEQIRNVSPVNKSLKREWSLPIIY